MEKISKRHETRFRDEADNKGYILEGVVIETNDFGATVEIRPLPHSFTKDSKFLRTSFR